MAADASVKRSRFRALHEQGCFILPNPWDPGGAQRLERIGFKALATTGAGYAWSLGRQDGQLTRDETLDHLRTLCAATNLPVNADFETGYAHDPEDLFTNVLLAVQTGVAGLSIEDRNGRDLLDIGTAVERVRVARRAIDRSGEDVLLVGRSEGHFIGKPDLEATIRRLIAYSDAGADCLYAPGVYDLDDIARIVSAVHPKPVNVMIIGPGLSVASLAAVGVRRVSVGASLAVAALKAFDATAQLLLTEGTLPARG